MRKIHYTLFMIFLACYAPLFGMRTACTPSRKRAFTPPQHNSNAPVNSLAPLCNTLQKYYKTALYLTPHIHFNSETKDYETSYDERLLSLAITYKASYPKLVWLQELAMTVYNLQKEPPTKEGLIDATTTLRTFLHNLGYYTDTDRFLSNALCNTTTNTYATTIQQILAEQGALLNKLTVLIAPFCNQQHPRVHRYYNLVLGKPNSYALVQQRLGLYDEIQTESIPECTLTTETHSGLA